MEDQLKAIIRRQESIEKTLNLIYKDRDIMEETHTRVGMLQDEIQLLKERVQKLEKNVTADLKDVTDHIVETKDTLEAIASE